MESKAIVLRLIYTWMLVLFFRFAASNIDKDKEECEDKVIGLAKCLTNVSGEAEAPPTRDCCTGLGQVIHKSPRCVCLLVKDRNDPSLGLKINATLALTLPTLCQVPANISDCTRLLHLPPDSPDAKLFDEFANNGTEAMSARARPRLGKSLNNGTETILSPNSDGGKRNRCLRCDIASWFLTTVVVVMVNLQYIFHDL